MSILAVGSMTMAGAANVQAVTMEEVLQDVVATNPLILEKQKAYNAALAEQKDARSKFLPKVIFTGDIGFKAYRDAGTNYDNESDGFYDARLNVSQLLYDWGKTASFEAARKNYMLGTLYSYVDQASQVTYETIVSYLNVLKYNELRELAMHNVVTHENLLESVKLQVERGKKGRSELERVNGRMAAAQSRLLLRENDYKNAVYKLHKMLGRFTPVEEMVMPDLDVKELPGSLKEALDIQVKFNPQLREAFYNVAQKKAEYESKKSDLGVLSLEGVLSIDNEFDQSDEYESEASIALRYRHTLFDAGRSKKVQAATSQVHRQQQKGYQVRRTLLNDIQLSWAAHKLLSEQIGVLKKNLYFTERSLESYKKEFVLGRRSLINILDAQNENQYVSERLVEAVYSREEKKYKILYSEGVLLSKLGLLNPLAKTMIETDSGYVPMSDDVLPLNNDFDQDGVEDAVDVSMNSAADDSVNGLGINKKYDVHYILDTVAQDNDRAENIVGSKDSLARKPLQLNVSTRFDFDAFLPGGLSLTSIMTKKMMKDLLEQSRAYNVQTPLFITVSTNEYDDETKNYTLALERAYTLKSILQKHRISDKGVFVFADTNAPEGHNYLRMKFTDRIADYKHQYVTHSVDGDIFVEGKNEIKDFKALSRLIAAIGHSSGKVDILLYSNELPNMEQNRQLGLQRSILLKNYFEKQGLGTDKVSMFSWGSFKEDPILPESRRVKQFIQYVLRD